MHGRRAECAPHPPSGLARHEEYASGRAVCPRRCGRPRAAGRLCRVPSSHAPTRAFSFLLHRWGGILIGACEQRLVVAVEIFLLEGLQLHSLLPIMVGDRAPGDAEALEIDAASRAAERGAAAL